MDNSNQEPNLISIQDTLAQIAGEDGDKDLTKIKLNPDKIKAKVQTLLNRSQSNRATLEQLRKDCGTNTDVWARYQACLDDLMAKIGEGRITFDLAMANTSSGADMDPERLKSDQLKLEVT